MMNNAVYIKCIWICTIIAMLTYCGVFIHFKGEHVVVLANGAEWTDIIYYTSIKVSLFFGSLSFSFASMVMCDAHRDDKMWFYLKYFIYCITAIFGIRMCFHFRYYDIISIYEIGFYLLSILLIIFRSITVNYSHEPISTSSDTIR